jgi:hypothetical protein
LLLSQCLLSGFLSLSFLLSLYFEAFQLLLFVALVSLRQSNLLGLDLQFDFSLLIQFRELLRLILYFLG